MAGWPFKAGLHSLSHDNAASLFHWKPILSLCNGHDKVIARGRVKVCAGRQHTVLGASGGASKPSWTWPLRASLTSGTLLLLSDLLAQVIEHSKKEVSKSNKSHLLSSSPSETAHTTNRHQQAGTLQGVDIVGELIGQSCSPREQTNDVEKEDVVMANSSGIKSVLESSIKRTTLLLSEHYRPVRTLRMALYGFFLYGPILDTWYRGLDKLLPTGSLKSTVGKVVLSQTVLNPSLLLLVFAYNYAWMGKMQNLPEKYRRDLLPTMVNGWRFWIPVSCATFAFMPLQFRVLFSSLSSLMWNCYVSSTVAR